MYRAVSVFLPIVCSLLALAALLWWLDPKTIADALLGFSWQPLTAVGLVLFVGAALAGLRLRSLAHRMGHDLTFRDAMQAMALGQIGGTLSIQFFGQVAVRTALLRSRGVQLPENIALASLEKLASFAVAFALALGGAAWLFGEVALQLDQGGFRFLHLVLGSLAAAAGGALLGWGHLFWRPAHQRPANDLTRDLTRPLLASVAYTVGIQLCTAAGYIVAAMALVPGIPVGNLAAASFVIMFAASLPISLSGWGVRELSAVFVLKAIGVPPGTAVAIAVSIGMLSLLVIAAIAALSLALPKRSAATAPAFSPRREGLDMATALAWLVPLLVATLIVIQVQAPTPSGVLNVNPADPLAVIGAALFVHAVIKNGTPAWRVSWLSWHVATMTAAIVLSFLIGALSFGLTDWAVFNRLLGWFVLLAYASTGALIAQAAGANGARICLNTFVGAVLGAAAIGLMMIAGQNAGHNLSPHLPVLPLEGLSGNRNGFAFLLVMALACTPVIGANPVVLALLGLGIWFAGSFAGLGAAVLVVLAGALQGYFPALALIKAAVLASAAMLLFAAAPTLTATTGDEATLSALVYSDFSMAERLKSLSGGLKLFLQHPFFGAGLGAYMETQTQLGTPLVIHSTPLWLLAEMGLAGFAAFAWFGWKLVRDSLACKDRREAAVLLLAILGFCAMSAVHDMMYQRSIWLLAGALLVTSAGRRDSPP
ncbi:MAG: lysylphosphatidylglycerol synthase domain-containing protein [Xanthobacteraceae bacterium]|nr:lysylphosphatidylglycerol synthase domain-containing protein [Xanthobacteraceae bacterium]